MPTLTTSIEDTSPVIAYSGSGGSDWTSGTSKVDPDIEQYSQSSYMVTKNKGATVAFSFYGTGVQLFGAKRSTHGYYQITIDTLTYNQVNGQVPNDTNDVFQTQLFSTVALQNGYHTVKMASLGTANLDLDCITWQTPIGLTDESLLVSTVQDTDSSFKYTPESSWNPSPYGIGMFSGGSGHSTTSAGAFVEYTFEGDSVAVYGPVGPNGAPYSVQLDGGASANYSSNKVLYRPQTMLFQASQLGGGKHTVKLRSEAWNNSALTLAVDYAEVFTTPSLQGGSGSTLSIGAIVGIVIGGFLALIVTAGLYIIFRRLQGSKTGRYFRLKGKSEKTSTSTDPVTAPFDYHPLDEPGSASHHSLGNAGSQAQLRSQTSNQSLHPTPPSTGLWPSSGGNYALPEPYVPDSRHTMNAQTQIITIPYTADGKYRPDLSPPPQLMPPPQRQELRRNPSANQGSGLQVRQSRSQIQLLALPPSAQSAMPNTTIERAERTQNEQSQPAAMVLAPVRRPGNMSGAPPDYGAQPGRF
ncbi:hypothetical protein B0H34DRAFT_806139 [Crassisporium funariophilum]|nr:hypothetical protein B0H34DRAFT_806139 [Crassisporium funariophilum]